MPSSPNQIMMTGTPSFYDNGDASDDDSLEEQLQDMMKHCDVSPGDAHKSTSLFDGFEYEEGFTEDAEVYEAIRDALVSFICLLLCLSRAYGHFASLG